MTDIASMEALLAKCEAATGPDREIDGAVALLNGWTCEKMKGDQHPYWRKPGVTVYWNRAELPSYTESIDAIVALIERELPGWTADADLCAPNSENLTYGARLFPPIPTCNYAGEARSSALALCAAFLRAKIAMERKP